MPGAIHGLGLIGPGSTSDSRVEFDACGRLQPVRAKQTTMSELIRNELHMIEALPSRTYRRLVAALEHPIIAMARGWSTAKHAKIA